MLRLRLITLLPLLPIAVSSLFVQSQDPLQTELRLDDPIPVKVKVPVHLGVMSKCPDALLCESVFDQVIQRVGDKMDLELIYVAKINTSSPPYNLTCMHGPSECAGNIQQLCVKKYAPSFQEWWAFVQCQNYQGREKIGGPDVAVKCARMAGIDWEGSGVGECAGLAMDDHGSHSGKGLEGVRLLQESVDFTRELGVSKSCTILINYEKVCVHDSTWKECEDGHTPSDFARKITTEWERLNSPSPSKDLDEDED